MDIPEERSSHELPTPKGGGIGILASFIFLSIYFHLPVYFWVPAVILSIISLVGDRIELSPKLRLLIQLMANMSLFVIRISSCLMIILIICCLALNRLKYLMKIGL